MRVVSKQKAFFSLVVALSIIASVMLSFPLNAQNPDFGAAELRSVWLTNIDSDVLFERSRLALALQRLDELNFNTVYPTVWNWGWTLYPSSTLR